MEDNAFFFFKTLNFLFKGFPIFIHPKPQKPILDLDTASTISQHPYSMNQDPIHRLKAEERVDVAAQKPFSLLFLPVMLPLFRAANAEDQVFLDPKLTWIQSWLGSKVGWDLNLAWAKLAWIQSKVGSDPKLARDP